MAATVMQFYVPTKSSLAVKVRFWFDRKQNKYYRDSTEINEAEYNKALAYFQQHVIQQRA